MILWVKVELWIRCGINKLFFCFLILLYLIFSFYVCNGFLFLFVNIMLDDFYGVEFGWFYNLVMCEWCDFLLVEGCLFNFFDFFMIDVMCEFCWNI